MSVTEMYMHTCHSKLDSVTTGYDDNDEDDDIKTRENIKQSDHKKCEEEIYT